MVIKRSCLSLILFICCLTVNAQFDAQFSQYWAVMGYYNPAHVGQNDKLNVVGAYSQQLVGFTNAPKSMYFSADMLLPLWGKKHGVGINLFNETIGLFKNQSFAIDYSYKLRSSIGQFSLGGQIGMLNIGFDPSGLELTDSKDVAFPTSNVNGMSMDASLGILYTKSSFYSGLSVSHFLSPTILLDKNNEIKISPVYYLMGGYNIKTKNPLVWLQPSFMLKSDFVSTKLDLTGRVFYAYNENTFYGGMSYSPSTSITFLVGAKIKNVGIGYAYDMFTSAIGARSGSHDLFVTYSTNLNFSNKSKNRHKSIRFL